MAKRTATTELNHDNWDAEDVAEEPGTFQQASADVLKGRVIKQARRRNVDNNGEDKPKGFVGFGGFGPLKTTAAPSFAFLNQEAATDKKAPENGSIKPVPKTDESAHEKEYLSSLRALNESVSVWIADHVKENPCCVLTPVFLDYDKHLKKLEANRKQSTAATPSESFTFSQGKKEVVPPTSSTKVGFNLPKSEAPSSGLNFFSSPSPSSASAPSTTPSITTPFSFSTGNNHKAATTTIFGSATKTEFSFGKPPLSDEKKIDSSPAPFSFGFGGFKPAALGEKKDEEEAKGDEEDEDEPPKVEVQQVQEDDAFYSIRCKLFYKKDSSYVEKGVGTLYLKKVNEDKTQLIVRADTSLGNILLNIILNPQLTTQRVGKNNVMLVCVPHPPIDPKTPPVPTPMLLRVKTDTEADELLAKLDEAKK